MDKCELVTLQARADKAAGIVAQWASDLAKGLGNAHRAPWLAARTSRALDDLALGLGDELENREESGKLRKSLTVWGPLGSSMYRMRFIIMVQASVKVD